MTTFEIIWILCGIAAATYTFGSCFAELQDIWKELPEHQAQRRGNHYRFSALMAAFALICPPIGIVLLAINDGGWRIK